MRKILPILLALIGLGAGVGAGMTLRPEPNEFATLGPCGETPNSHDIAELTEDGEPQIDNNALDYVKLNNQFVVPVVKEGAVAALVVLSLSLEMTSGGPELVYQREPKLRDAFLQVLFDHANTGGFDGSFTSGQNMDNLRHALREAANKALGSVVSDVLIVDVARQDT